MAETCKMTQAWLKKAQSDRKAAELLAAPNARLLDSAVYHCQQVAEKATKGFLHHNGQVIQRTHDVSRLLEQAFLINTTFDAFRDDADLLTPLATAFRYPCADSWNSASEPETEDAHAAATRIYEFVLSVLPSETYPV